MMNKRLDASVPIYISNFCDSACRMCGMNKNNEKLIRINGDREAVKKQLEIVYFVEGIRWVMILSGEYKKGAYRIEHLTRVIQAVNDAFHIGFERVTLNIGALDDDEIELLKSGFGCPDKVGLAIFQETYDRIRFEQEFGKYSKEIPKSDFDNRLQTPERWLAHGFHMANIGILLGAGNLRKDVDSLILHSQELKRHYPCLLQISLPRIVGEHGSCSDSEFIHTVQYIKGKIPWAEIIITTREEKEIIEKLLPYINVISPGTSEVLGYTEKGAISNAPDKSQFFVRPVRERPSEVLSYFQSKCNIDFNYWEGGQKNECK